jgi:hypothetical protein
MPSASPATCATLNHTTPVLPNPCSTTRMQALAISRPTPFSRKNRVYSRRSPVRARCRKVQWRFMKNDEVAATATEPVLAPSDGHPNPRYNRLARPKSTTVLMAPTMPNLASSWTRCRQRS